MVRNVGSSRPFGLRVECSERSAGRGGRGAEDAAWAGADARGRCRYCAAWRPVRRRGFWRRALEKAGRAGCDPGNPAAAAISCQPPPTPGVRAVRLVFCSFETRSLCVTEVRLEGTVAQDVLEHAAMLLPQLPTLQTLLLALD